MVTLATEAEKLDDKEKKAGALVAKEGREQLIPEVAADLVFLDDVTLLSGVIPTLKPAGFILVHSNEPVPEKIENMAVISKKMLTDKTITLLRKVGIINSVVRCRLSMRLYLL